MHPLESYLKDMLRIRATGEATDETSYYSALTNLLNEVGKTLKPKVRCVLTIRNRGAGHPDGGLFSEDQWQQIDDDLPLGNQAPSRGVVEVKGLAEGTAATIETPQVARYWRKYRKVIVTDYRDFVLVGEDLEGHQAPLERFCLAESEGAFWDLAARPRRAARQRGDELVDYLRRVILIGARIADPQDLAWLLASYARQALRRIEGSDLPALATIRSALEEALGMTFSGEKGEHFFESTFVQTLFYGVFSAWVLWARRHGPADRRARFDWRHAAEYLRVPILRKLFHEATEPGQLYELRLAEILQWAAACLNRVDRPAFFAAFREEHAVQYFYEPFLQAYDPVLRKDLGVWYTPEEIVRYQVARVDTVLREELDIADGLADPNVYVLDPCCGTGAYLVEVLRTIHQTLKEKGGDALMAQDLKRAAMDRVFGFEILPAPFVISHLQLGLLLQDLGAPLANRRERVAVYLTNALTGWEPPKEPKQRLLFAELQAERDAAEKVKRETPILVILGNPPYNGFAGVAMDEERDLPNAYRTTTRAPAPQGQGLNDLYVRFLRVAERRIVDMTGHGVVSFITNYSWLDGLSHTGMRERYLAEFDRIWIDRLNGDKFRTGKLTPDGEPDPSVFSTELNREGIQIGTAIALLVRRQQHQASQQLLHRDFWGRTKRLELLASLLDAARNPYHELSPQMEIGCPFAPIEAAAEYLSWPRLPDLLSSCCPAVKTSRDLGLVHISEKELRVRMERYFDPDASDEEVEAIAPALMEKRGGFDPRAARLHLIRRGFLAGNLVRYCYRPFDVRWVYWEPETDLLDRKRDELFRWAVGGNVFVTSRQKGERQKEGTPFFVTPHLADWHLTRPGSTCFPLYRVPPEEQRELHFEAECASLRGTSTSDAAVAYLEHLGLSVQGRGAGMLLWMQILAVGYSPTYLSENAGALWQDYPRIPLPASKEALEASAALGEQVAGLLDTERGVGGVTEGRLRVEMPCLGVVRRVGGGSLDPNAGDLDLTVGWGHAGARGVTMPGKGRVEQRAYTPAEREAIAKGAEALELSPDQALACLGEDTRDIYLNGVAYWSNVPARVWDYRIGGYQVIKKWLSYRERKLLGRGLRPDEAKYVTEIVRRLAALRLLEPALDANYERVKQNTYPFPAAGGPKR